MKPTDPNHPWQRLVASARRAPDDRDTAAPYGFAARMAALALAAERPVASLFERLSLRALGVACLLALVSVAANYTLLSTPPAATQEEEVAVADEDPVAAILDLSS